MDFDLNASYFANYVQTKKLTSSISLKIGDFISINANNEQLCDFLKNLTALCHPYTFASILLKISKNQAHSNRIISENSDDQNEPLFMKKLYELIIENINEKIFCDLFLQTEKIENLDEIQTVDEVIFFSDFVQKVKNKKYISNIVKYLACIVDVLSKKIESSYKNTNLLKKEFVFSFFGSITDFLLNINDFSNPLSIAISKTLKKLDHLEFAITFFILNVLRKNDLILIKKKSFSGFFRNKFDSYFFIYGFILNLICFEKDDFLIEIAKRVKIITKKEITNEKIVDKLLAFSFITNDELFFRISHLLIDSCVIPKIKIIYSILKIMKFDTSICIDFLLSDFEFLQMLLKLVNVYKLNAVVDNKANKKLDDFFRMLKLKIEHTHSEFDFDITPLISKIDLIIKKI